MGIAKLHFLRMIQTWRRAATASSDGRLLRAIGGRRRAEAFPRDPFKKKEGRVEDTPVQAVTKAAPVDDNYWNRTSR